MELNSPRFEYCLLYLLELFSVNIQSQLRAVCSLWKSLIEQRIWCKVKNIRMSDEEVGVYLVLIDDCSSIPCKVSSTLERFFTNEHFTGVTSLDLDFFCDNKPSSKSLVSHCLTQWTFTLTDLKLTPFSEYSRECHSALWRQIDTNKSLKSLELNLCELDGSDWTVPNNLSILANLEKFILNDAVNDQMCALTQLGPILKQLLYVESKSATIPFLNSTVPKWVSLRELCIYCKSTKLLDHLTALAQLKQLNKLELKAVDWDRFNSLITPSHSREYPKLISVKHLDIRFLNTTQHSDPRHQIDQFDRFFFACMPIMFPSLETIKVEMFGPDDQQFVDVIQDKMKRKFVALVHGQFVLRPYVRR